MSTLHLSATLSIDIPWGFLEAASSFLNFQSSYRLRNAYGVLLAIVLSCSFQAKEYKNVAVVHFCFSHFLYSVLGIFHKHLVFSALSFPHTYTSQVSLSEVQGHFASLKGAIKNGRGSWHCMWFFCQTGGWKVDKNKKFLETKIRRKQMSNNVSLSTSFSKF